MNYIDWFSNAKPSLHSLNNPHLGMIYCFFMYYILLSLPMCRHLKLHFRIMHNTLNLHFTRVFLESSVYYWECEGQGYHSAHRIYGFMYLLEK